MENSFALNPNPLVRHLQKSSTKFTKEDIIHYMETHSIHMINFRYVAEDGRLKTLNFAPSNKEHLDLILSAGERVDGSSLFSFMKTGSSDLYVVPRYSTAFLNPFSETPQLEILCFFYDHKGDPVGSAPDNILRKALSKFREDTDLDVKFLGELEYYVNSPKSSIFPSSDQKGYHESEPFAKFESMRKEALKLIAQCGGIVKYGHSEVGSFTQGDEAFEQHEIEFLPTDPIFAADQILISKWILRMLAEKMEVEISFAPKITVGKAGNGLHFHMLLEQEGKNILLEEGKLSDTAQRAIVGVLDCADAITAFGNTIPTSYLRLVPNQEAPTKICWGDRNRHALVRVPLGWNEGAEKMVQDANPNVKTQLPNLNCKQTFEFRAADGSANIHLTLAALIVAIKKGLEDEGALKRAHHLYLDKKTTKQMKQLPTSCEESAQRLHKKRAIFEKGEVFPKEIINHIIDQLTHFHDTSLSEEIYNQEEKIHDLVMEYIHCQ